MRWIERCLVMKPLRLRKNIRDMPGKKCGDILEIAPFMVRVYVQMGFAKYLKRIKYFVFTVRVPFLTDTPLS